MSAVLIKFLPYLYTNILTFGYNISIIGKMNNTLSYKLMTMIGFIREVNKSPFSYKTAKKILEHLDSTDYKISTLRKEFSNLKREGFVEFKTRYRKPVPILTQKGKFAIKTHLPFKSYGLWDEKWRVVIFDIPESERKYRLLLRDKLAQLGFGKLQNSVYVAPYPLLGSINRFACAMGIRQYLRFLEASRIDDEKKLVEKAWDLESVNEAYESFINRSKKAKKDIYWPLRAKKLEQEFSQLYENDPHLPETLLPKDWVGTRAYKTFKEISNSY